MKPAFTTSIGSISSGTMRPKDLIPTFAGELRRLMKQCRVERTHRKELTSLVHECRHWRTAKDRDFAGHDILNDLFDAIETFAPPYCYFGPHKDDGADYGFWPLDLDEQVQAGYHQTPP